ncbi:thiamine-phosphate kinase [Fulvivirga sp. RKSG066]|uniref:thiamine-phosphate kinase n=1 Tax=Fulvivirga aurantia TaxID=2529383 RepID=UPI0012BB5EDB|nr:thiamine-phosphate kinase [Fulvivirga aurantia]MTI21269.1 thiamine-phosphate kinase [Fulvivirga aurantia]
MEEKRTEINDLGEFGLIDKITKGFALTNKESVLGVGDDAAIVKNDDGEQLVVTSDMLLEGVHFDLSYIPLVHLGFKAVAVNVSDIAAMNAIPKQITVNIGLSNRFSVEAVDMLYQGIKAACDHYKVDLIGGDTTSSSSGLVLSITAIGVQKEASIVKRSGAAENDIICVTGDLGAAYIGLTVLEREKQVYLTNPNMQPQLDKYDYVVQRQLKPDARMDIIHELAELNIKPSSMIDISDGLASELLHLSDNSKVAMAIYEDKLPIDKQTYDTAYEFQLDPTTCALNGGEDYELLFTISQEDFEKLKNHRDIHFIGYVRNLKEGNVMQTKGGNTVPLQAQGWDHMKKEK